MTPPPKPQLDLTWQTHAYCKTAPQWVFFAELRTGSNNGRLPNHVYDPAREYCTRCPVRAHCLEQALTRPEEHGFWAGHEPAQLRKMRGQRIRRRHETAA